MSKLHAQLLMLHQVVLGILFITSIFLFNGQAILFEMATIVLLIQYSKAIKRSSEKINQIQNQRLKWILSQLDDLQGDYHSNPEKLWNFIQRSNAKFTMKLFNRELGIPQQPLEKIYIPPDLQEAENELIRSEERASILLGTLVFLPVLFGLLHLFRSVMIITYLSEMQVFFLLGQLVVLSQSQHYEFSSWGLLYKETEDLLEIIMKLGRQSILQAPGIFSNPYLQELGLESSTTGTTPAQVALGSIIDHTVSLPRNKRKQFLRLSLDKLVDLPKEEDMLSLRWRAYKNRLFLIGIASIAISAQIASIANYAVPQFNSGLLVLATTPYLSWGLLALSVGLNTIVLQYWVQGKQLVVITGIYTIIYLVVFFLNKLLFT